MSPIRIVRFYRIYLIAIIVFTTVLTSCKEDETGPKSLLLDFRIEPGFFPVGTDNWIFVSDRTGRILDTRRVNDSTRVKLTGLSHDIVTYTLVRIYPMSDVTAFQLATFQGVASGSVFEYKKPANGPQGKVPEILGTFPFTLTDYADSDRPHEALVFSDAMAMPFTVLDLNSTSYQGTTFAADLRVHQDGGNILITSYKNGLPVYMWLENPMPGKPLSVSFNDFKTSALIPINKAVTEGSVKIMKGTELAFGYLFNQLYSRQISSSTDPGTLPQLGYLPGFEKYHTYVQLNPHSNPINLSYTKAGTIPDKVILPDFTYLIQSKALRDIAVQFSNEYTYKYAYCFKDDGQMRINWTMNAPYTMDFNTPYIPEEITRAYPMLSIHDAEIEFFVYINNLDGFTYSDLLTGASRRYEEYEILRYVIQ